MEGLDFDTFVHFEDNVAGELQNEDIIADVCQQQRGDIKKVGESESDRNDNTNLKLINVCRYYISMKNWSEKVLNSLTRLQNEVYARKVKQIKLAYFFKTGSIYIFLNIFIVCKILHI
jgi:hypothetical protein